MEVYVVTDSNIEKFEGEFTKEELGVTILINETVRSIPNLDVMGLYLFLSLQPPKWEINPKHLMNHFGMGKTKVYGLLNSLI